MEVEHYFLPKPGSEHLVFDLLRRYPYKSHGVLLLRATISGNVNCSQNPAIRIENRRCRAGQEAICHGEMFDIMNYNGGLLYEGGAYCIGSAHFFRPDPARL